MNLSSISVFSDRLCTAPEILFRVFSADIESRKAVPDGCLRIFKPLYFGDVVQLVNTIWSHGCDGYLGFPNLDEYARYMAVAKVIKFLDGDIILCVQITLMGLAGSNPAISTRKPTHASMVDAMCANNRKQFLTAKAQQVLYFFETA